MTIAGKLNLIFLAAVLLLTSVLLSTAAGREYQVQLHNNVLQAQMTAASSIELQVEIYGRDEQLLKSRLADFLHAEVVTAIARDSLGQVLAQAPDDKTANAVDFRALRAGLSPAESGVSWFDGGTPSAEPGFWSGLFNQDSDVHVTLPVFSAVNPTEKDIQPLAFAAALIVPQSVNSRVVMGYVHVLVSQARLLDATISSISGLIIFTTMFALLICAMVLFVSWQFGRSLTQLAKLADDVSSGKLEAAVDISGSAEIREVANVLNSVIGGLSRRKNEIETDQRLLSMKVEERTSQLSERDEALSKAVEEISETRTQLHQMEHYDSLTSLPNRSLFAEQLSLVLRLNERNKSRLALLVLNLDNFKRINESLGHAAGDEVLREVGRRLSTCVRESDIVAHNSDAEPRIEVSRLGGDEFTIILNQLDSVEAAGEVARRIIDSLAAPIQVEGREAVVTPSIGIANAPTDAQEVEGLLRAATTAMQKVKLVTGERFLFYSQDMDVSTIDRVRLEADLRKAIAREELSLHYQPQVDTINGSVVGAEALLRWQHPEFGDLPPNQFIAMAEEMGYSDQLGDWVLEEACKQLAAFAAKDLKLSRVAINVAAPQFKPELVQLIEAMLLKYDLEPSSLELGLAQSTLMDKRTSVAQSLNALKELGVYLSVDDFGTSHEPLIYLTDLPIDEIKLDRRFVRSCVDSDGGAGLAAGIIALANSLKLPLVAEGVETPEQYRFLTGQGVKIVQGYLFSKPVPAEEFQHLLAPWHFMEQVQSTLA
ncbi:MAG: EAL domain-containing protein [Halioglobus sp.]